MKKKMNALVYHAPHDYRYEKVPVPEVGPGEMLIKTKACGICAGDIKAYHGGIRIWGTDDSNRYIEPPVIGGHEFYGEVVEIGEGVTGFAIGDSVLPEQIIPCNECPFCLAGKYWMCVDSAIYGFKAHGQGGFAEYTLINSHSIVHKLPSGFTPEQSVMVEPIACGMHAVEMGQIKHSDVVVLAGLGAIGTSMVNLIKLNLPRMIIAIEIKDHRIEMGKKYGADLVLNPLKCDVVAEIMKATNGLGCDLYIEASGAPQSVNQGLNALKNLGRYVQMGVFAEEVSADWNVIGDGKELTIKGSHLSGLTYPSVIEGMKSGLIKTEGLITHSYPLSEWEKAFETAQTNDKAMKVMLIP